MIVTDFNKDSIVLVFSIPLGRLLYKSVKR